MKVHTKETQASTTPRLALEFLRQGNQRFVNNLRLSRELLQQANETRDGQWPFATILSCIDSRTSAELIFDQGLGDIFSIRIAGTVVNTEPALDLDALLGGLKPVVKGLDGAKVNEISSAVIELLQGEGGALAAMLSSTSAFTQNLAARDQLIGDVITNLNTVLGTVDEKGAEFDASVDQLQKLITGLAEGRDPIAGAIGPLATAENDLTEMLETSRRPIQGVIENVRPFAQRMDERKADVNKVIEPLAENYLRLNALGAYGSFFNIYFCSVKIKINGPAGGDIVLPAVKPPASNNGRCDFAK